MSAVTSDLFGDLDPVGFAIHRLGFTPDPQQALVLSSPAARGILNCTRQWGKSTVVAARAVHHAFHYPESLSLVLSPSARQSAEFLRKVKQFLRRLDIRPRGDGHNEISVLLPNAARIVGLPGNEDTIRGFSAVSLLLIDEAARVPDPLYHAVRPMLAAADRATLWLLSTPNGRQGFFYDEWINAAANWTRISVPATECPRIKPSHLAEERNTLGDLVFRQEYLCEFLDDGHYLFDDQDLAACFDPAVQPLTLEQI
jgi:hypothetical protein